MSSPKDTPSAGELSAAAAPDPLLTSFQHVAKCGVDALKQLGRELKVRACYNFCGQQFTPGGRADVMEYMPLLLRHRAVIRTLAPESKHLQRCRRDEGASAQGYLLESMVELT